MVKGRGWSECSKANSFRCTSEIASFERLMVARGGGWWMKVVERVQASSYQINDIQHGDHG